MKKKRALNGTGRRFAIINRYRQRFSSKSRKVRCDAITGEEIQRFCHESQWGGRIDTLKLAKQPVIVEQPRGGFEYEAMRSYQYTVNEMYTYFKESEYGARQRVSNNGRNLSLRRFRELICPCMTCGIAMITSLPEVIEKKCKRMNIAYKLGDVTIIVDILEKLTSELDVNNPKPEGTVEFIKNVTGKLLQKTILLSDVVLYLSLIHTIMK